ncbi:TPA: hypothetical protein DEP86_02580 [Candidatus Uhrbacteria bacterium]|nr:hypothetical protein [Candidatus Uhrbacteria bacterium]
MDEERERKPNFTLESGRETIEQKKERLKTLLQGSLEVWNDRERSLFEGSLTFVQLRKDGIEQTVPNLIVVSVEEGDVELCVIEEDGEAGSSAYMTWDSIVDARKE